jgi:hypothetical protein
LGVERWTFSLLIITAAGDFFGEQNHASLRSERWIGQTVATFDGRLAKAAHTDFSKTADHFCPRSLN